MTRGAKRGVIRMTMGDASEQGASVENDAHDAHAGDEPPSLDEMRRVFERVAANARAGGGAAKAIAAAVAMLRRAPWLEGELRIEVAGDERSATVDLFTELGGVRERLFAAVTLAVPMADFAAGVRGSAELFSPLALREHAGKLVLTPASTAATVPPPLIEVADDCLDWDPHKMPTVKRPAFVMPEAFRSGGHKKHGG
jgi:hypothetical protein